MNFNQIRYFIATAKCRSVTKAAEQLHITQPALSHQIVQMESELNLLLFLRHRNKSIELTPAGELLLEEFKAINDRYEASVSKARRLARNVTGEIRIGVLDETYIGDFMPAVINYFQMNYPTIHIDIRYYSFHDLLSNLYSNSLDLIFTLHFHVENLENLENRILSKEYDCMVMPASHPAAALDVVTAEDFKDDNFVVLSTEECSVSTNLILEWLRRSDVRPEIIYAPDVRTLQLMIEAGCGVCIGDTRSTLSFQPNLVFKRIESFWDPSLTISWLKENNNPVVPMMIEQICRALAGSL